MVYTNNNSIFPDQVVPESEKKSLEYGLAVGNAIEQEWFRKYLDIDVIGTEISDTASEFPNTIEWDFHETKPEWLNSVDFIYSIFGNYVLARDLWHIDLRSFAGGLSLGLFIALTPTTPLEIYLRCSTIAPIDKN